jgi:hypothetical protein
MTLNELAKLAKSDEDEGPDDGEDFRWRIYPDSWYDPDLLRALAARVRLRQSLGLPKRDCVLRKPPAEASDCECLSESLDAALKSHEPTKEEVLKTARKAHAERWAWLKRKPEPVLPATDEVVPVVKAPAPKPPAELVTQTQTKPLRIRRNEAAHPLSWSAFKRREAGGDAYRFAQTEF